MIDSLRRTVRSLRRAPTYAAASIISVAVGLALAAATFAFITSVLLPAPQSPDADRMYSEQLRFGDRRNAPPVIERVRLLETIPGIEDIVVTVSAGIGEPELNRMQYAFPRAVSEGFWRFYGITPRLGRLPNADDLKSGRAILVSDPVWHQEFDNRESLQGATMRIGDGIFTVIGVISAKDSRGIGADILVPLAGDARLSLRGREARGLNPGIRIKLKPGITRESLRPHLDRVAGALNTTYGTPGTPPYRLDLLGRPARAFRIDAMEVLLYVLGFGVLAIGCTNVAALTLARGMTRRRDYALRAALGASRRAIATEVFAEVAGVAVVGGVLGIGLTYALLGMMRRAMPVVLTWSGIEVPTIDARVLGFCIAAIAVSVLVSGAYPAWRASRVAPSDPLKDGAGTTTGRSRGEFRFLVFGELAVATVLLMMASLVSMSLRNIANFDFGFSAQSVVTTTVRVGASGVKFAPEDLRRHRERSLEIVRATPGVRSAAYFGNQRMTGDTEIGSDRSAAGEPTLSTRTYTSVGPGFFGALGIRVRQGRDFEAGDIAEGAAIVSAPAAAILFPRGDAVGRTIKLGRAGSDAKWVRVVGVSDDFMLEPDDSFEDRVPPVFLVEQDSAITQWSVMAMASGAPASLLLPLQTRLRDGLPPRSRVSASGFSARMTELLEGLGYFTRMFTTIGFAALALGALGVFSVLSYVVGQREREFAVRVSLGASPANLVRMVMRNALEFALGGTAIGALLSFWASSAASAFLFGVKNTDPVSLVITEVTLTIVTLLAALAPALRASRANPLDVLRSV